MKTDQEKIKELEEKIESITRDLNKAKILRTTLRDHSCFKCHIFSTCFFRVTVSNAMPKHINIDSEDYMCNMTDIFNVIGLSCEEFKSI